MKVMCTEKQIYSAPLVLPFNLENALSEDNYIYTLYCEDTVGITLTPLKTYDVYAILCVNRTVYYLLDNQKDNISFYPAELFRVIERNRNSDWMDFTYTSDSFLIQAIGPAIFVGEYLFIREIIMKSRGMMYTFLEYKQKENEE